MTLPDPSEWPASSPVAYPTRDLLRSRARSTPDASALIDADADRKLTYGAFDARASARATELASGPVAEPERVGLLLESGPAFPELYFASARAGATLVPLNVRLDADTLASQVERATLDVILCDHSTEADAVAAAPSGVPVVPVARTSEASASSPEPGTDEDADDGDSERLIIFTSGTTGVPKGVRLTLGNLVSSAVASADRLGVSPGDRWLACLPMYHVGGLAPVIRSTLYGTTVVLQRAFDPAATADVMESYDVTCVSLVPTMLGRLLDQGWSPPASLRFVLLGGGPVPSSLIDRCEALGVPVCPTYGATETASQVATALPETAFERRGTVGRPLRDTAVAIVDDEGAARESGAVGEIVVDGPTVSPGYLDPERTAEAFGDRGFETGDLGYRDEEGHLWVVGRADDRIVTGGENVAPSRVAAAICELPGVADAVVVGLPDEEWGERVAALVKRTDADLSRSALLDHCRAALADFEVPKVVRFADALPRTASGTVDRDAAKRSLEDG